MLGIKGGLLKYLLRRILLITLVAIPIACLFAVLWRDVLEWRNGWAAVFIVIHSRLIVLRFARFDRGSFAFLHTRGFSRDTIWVHNMLASWLSALAVWVPVAVIIWSPLRGLVQDVLFRSPYFPIMAPREAMAPFAWLIGYGILIPLFHYQWIRKAQPVKGGMGGVFVVTGVIAAIAVLMMEGSRHAWFGYLVAAAGIVAVPVTVIASWRLHRRLEVRA